MRNIFSLREKLTQTAPRSEEEETKSTFQLDTVECKRPITGRHGRRSLWSLRCVAGSGLISSN